MVVISLQVTKVIIKATGKKSNRFASQSSERGNLVVKRHTRLLANPPIKGVAGSIPQINLCPVTPIGASAVNKALPSPEVCQGMTFIIIITLIIMMMVIIITVMIAL